MQLKVFVSETHQAICEKEEKEKEKPVFPNSFFARSFLPLFHRAEYTQRALKMKLDVGALKIQSKIN